VVYRHVVVTQHGGPEVLCWVEDDLPVPQSQEVRIRVLATGAAFTDVLIREGLYPGVPKPPFSPGYEVVGIVDQVGDDVTSCQPGQRVAALTVTGGYSEFICLPAVEVVPVPTGVASAEAACLVLQYVTAHQLLHRVAQVSAGQRVLIHGAGGGVGTALLELGQLAGLQMYGTASAGKHELVRRLGGIPIDYQHDNFADRLHELTDGAGVDVVLDGIGGTHLWASYQALAPGGHLVSYGFSAALKAAQRWRSLATTFALIAGLKFWPDGRQVSFYSITGLKQSHPDWFRADLTTLLHALEAGHIRPIIARTFPLQEAQSAHRLLEDSAVEGQLVLLCDGDRSSTPS
jgi:NADPH:quinone reductase-like Zn-dependent oxidoreductase